MNIGIISTGLSPKFVSEQGIRLEGFSSWSMERSGSEWNVSAQTSEPGEIPRWWIKPGVSPPFWEKSPGGSLLVRIAAAACPEAGFWIADALDHEGLGYEACVLAAWDWLIQKGPWGIILPLGCPYGREEPWQQRVNSCLSVGIQVYAPAGLVPGIPARLKGVVAVGDERLRNDPALDPEWKKMIPQWVDESIILGLCGHSTSALAAAWACGSANSSKQTV